MKWLETCIRNAECIAEAAKQRRSKHYKKDKPYAARLQDVETRATQLVIALRQLDGLDAKYSDDGIEEILRGIFPKPTNVSEIIGKWPGDETDAEFDELMREHEEKD
jgi:hypothetical protein